MRTSKCSNGSCEFDSHTTTKYSDMKINNVAFKVDEDNDLYEITVNKSTYTLDNVYVDLFTVISYKSLRTNQHIHYGNLFDELNILIDTI